VNGRARALVRCLTRTPRACAELYPTGVTTEKARVRINKPGPSALPARRNAGDQALPVDAPRAGELGGARALLANGLAAQCGRLPCRSKA
jgi:hypothetical protein